MGKKSTDESSLQKLNKASDRKNNPKDGRSSLQCRRCPQLCSSKSLLRIHNQLVHANKQPCECAECGRKFAEKSHLSNHFNQVHAGIKPHLCNVCGKACSRKDDLKKHMRIHTGERPYICAICGKGFPQKSHLPTHLIIHTGERPFTCELCGKSFARLHHLRTHSSTHTGLKPYACLVCNKLFSVKSSLQYHMAIHTGENKHSCDRCDAKFVRKHDLNKHLSLVHSYTPKSRILKKDDPNWVVKKQKFDPAESKFMCFLCGRRFVRNATLIRHQLLHQNPDSKVYRAYEESLKMFRSEPGLKKSRRRSAASSKLEERSETDDAASDQSEQECDVTEEEKVEDVPVVQCDTVNDEYLGVEVNANEVEITPKFAPGDWFDCSEISYKCGHCDSMFTKEYELDEHIRSHFEISASCDMNNVDYISRSRVFVPSLQSETIDDSNQIIAIGGNDKPPKLLSCLIIEKSLSYEVTVIPNLYK